MGRGGERGRVERTTTAMIMMTVGFIFQGWEGREGKKDGVLVDGS